MERKTSQAQRAAVKRYDAENTKMLHLKLNRRTDADILAHLETVDNVSGYLKALIRADMTKGADDDEQRV